MSSDVETDPVEDFPMKKPHKTGVTAHVTHNMTGGGESIQTVSRVVLHMVRSTAGGMSTENLPIIPGRYTVIVNSMQTSISLLPKSHSNAGNQYSYDGRYVEGMCFVHCGDA